VYVWGLARALGGRVLLRIEDHDRERSRPDYEASILEALAWLGLEPDGSAQPGGPPPLRQRDREPSYVEALERLREARIVYACSCSRREIGAGAGDVGGRELRYPGTCRLKRLPERSGLGLRVRMDPGFERFEDALSGEQTQDPAGQCGDLLIRDRAGSWTYQFAVTVDDLTQGIDLVVRGADLLESTGRQIRLARLLGRARPAVFLHHPLLFGPSGQKLSKSNHDAAVAELRRSGLTGPQVLGMAAERCGLTDRSAPLGPTDLEGLFSR
jgi:glutamyl/glutaminyl-tRNA synthetase